MQGRTIFPASMALVFLLAGCTPATPPTPLPDTRDADAKAIRQLETDWLQAFAMKDVEKITSYYADDASVFITGRPVISGKANIVSMIREWVDDKNSSGTFSSEKIIVSKSGDVAYSEGSNGLTYTVGKTKKVVSEKGKYVTVYMKQADGSWKCIADIFNADGPPVPAKK